MRIVLYIYIYFVVLRYIRGEGKRENGDTSAAGGGGGEEVEGLYTACTQAAREGEEGEPWRRRARPERKGVAFCSRALRGDASGKIIIASGRNKRKRYYYYMCVCICNFFSSLFCFVFPSRKFKNYYYY